MSSRTEVRKTVKKEERIKMKKTWKNQREKTIHRQKENGGRK